MAADFDLFLPLIQPVGLAVLGHLPKLPEGENVLDVACGTGEPGLTLARLSPGVHLLGIDSAAGMPAELLPPFERLCAGAAAARGLLSKAGLSAVESELFRWNMEFANQSDLWKFLSAPGLFTRQFAELDETNKEQVRSEVIGTLASS